MDFYEAVKARRTRYKIDSSSTISDERIETILRIAVKYAPSSFHSQSSRAILLLGKSHVKFWSLVKETLRARMPVEKFAPTEEKISSFVAGHGTILYYEDMDVVKFAAEISALCGQFSCLVPAKCGHASAYCVDSTCHRRNGSIAATL